jgi:hypothetical protein
LKALPKQLAIAGGGLAAGAGLMPVLIHFMGIALLGPYEGASLVHTYRSILEGLGHGSISSWIVVLGPYFLYLLVRGLGAWWHAVA